MVYQWEQHKNACYQLYINERRSLEDIMVHMKNVYQFTPRLVYSRRKRTELALDLHGLLQQTCFSSAV